MWMEQEKWVPSGSPLGMWFSWRLKFRGREKLRWDLQSPTWRYGPLNLILNDIVSPEAWWQLVFMWLKRPHNYLSPSLPEVLEESYPIPISHCLNRLWTKFPAVPIPRFPRQTSLCASSAPTSYSVPLLLVVSISLVCRAEVGTALASAQRTDRKHP